jgi:hypothetical protein
MLHLNQKFKPVLTKPVMEQDYNASIVPSVQGKGLNELISKIKMSKVRENHRKKTWIIKSRLVKKNIITN